MVAKGSRLWGLLINIRKGFKETWGHAKSLGKKATSLVRARKTSETSKDLTCLTCPPRPEDGKTNVFLSSKGTVLGKGKEGLGLTSEPRFVTKKLLHNLKMIHSHPMPWPFPRK